MTDVLIYQTTDGGEINITNGTVELSAGLDTAVYLSLFGGNEDDPGESDTTLQFWGNIGEPNVYRSKTQHLLRSIPAVPANLRRLEQAVLSDLQWMLDQSVATEIEATASMPALNRVRIVVTINGNSTLEYVENWNAASSTNN